ncbi:MAG: vWA domain-containing protein [Gemmatimonadaceae bacterium]
MLFLSPLWLALSAAALIPLLLHLRRRPQGRVVEFPAVRYLARATHDHERSLRARNSLLALLRMLIVMLLTLAAARPLARLGSGHGRAALAIVLDNSLSSSAVTNGRRVLDDERAVARAVISAANPDDRLWIVTADARVAGGDATSLRAMVDTIAPLAGAGDVASALRAATARSISVAGAAPAVVVLTDAQATSWRNVGAARVDAAWTPRSQAPPNRAVVGAEPRPARWTGNGLVHVTVTGASGDSLPLRVEVDGRTLGRAVMVPNGAGAGDADVAVAAPPSGWSAARAVLPPDELAADDERWFATWNAPPPRVSSHAGPFVDRAVDALVSAGVVAAGSDVDIVSAADGISRPALIVAPLDPSRVGDANRALARAGVPWRLGAERRGASRARGDGLTTAEVKRRYALSLTATAGADTLASVGGEPWIVAGDGYVLVASALDTSATTLPATAEFVPWLARVLSERLSVGGRPAVYIVPGSTVALPPGADGVELPSGERAAITDSLRPQRAGVYFWTRGGARIGAVVVNGEVEESVLQRLADDEMRQRLRPVVLTHEASGAASAAFRGASRRPLGTLLLSAVLAALVLETLVAAAGGQSRRASAAAHGAR